MRAYSSLSLSSTSATEKVVVTTEVLKDSILRNGEEHTFTALQRFILGQHFLLLEQPADAEAELRKALHLWRKLYSPNHPDHHRFFGDVLVEPILPGRIAIISKKTRGLRERDVILLVHGSLADGQNASNNVFVFPSFATHDLNEWSSPAFAPFSCTHCLYKTRVKIQKPLGCVGPASKSCRRRWESLSSLLTD